ncbi:ribosome maturation factor RimP [Tsukamurella paurometabola]|uniref:Ribosome maturation factor RimP n=1 Tax=Tsukamurella paurometabola TaxID=2061 RepID=A0A3P8K985_TSUPA|nr:ribosome maturation factor RimP [Tsukamurella paurometabola]MBS4101436.1 ribosome maturation factor RimP [Tsukamurella paurometabola]UEA84089.1 ribosome maturation factor RimP [Tsukamurella paurometabola]VDR41254.1 Ribosome maturation factor RimP [Tsukamurella paurometabola]
MAYDEAKVLAVIAPHLDAAGLDLERLKINNAGTKSSIAVVVDSDAGPTLDELAEVARTLSAAVDDADDVFGAQAFTLEVTTPGAERPLTEPRHWRRARGRQAAIELTDGTNLLARIGRLTEDGPRGATVTVVLPGVKGAAPTTRDLDLAEVAAAAVRVEFRRPNPKEMELSGIMPGRVESGAEPEDLTGEDAGAAQRNED